jgi:hypothetical protein
MKVENGRKKCENWKREKKRTKESRWMQLKTFFFFLLFSFLQTKTKTKERAFSTE